MRTAPISKSPLTSDDIRELLPHRHPMLLVDRVLEVSEAGVIAEKLVSAADPFLQGHFPERPIMPGVLILEALAQTAAIGIYWNEPAYRGRGIALVGLDKVRFRKPVFPGDILRLNVVFGRTRGKVLRAAGTAAVEAETVAEAEFMAAIVDWEKIT